MSEVTHSVPPSADVLAEAARRVALAYPDLFAHQRTGVTFLLSRRRAILADDMGLGKSRTAIIALREAAPDGPYLIVCPAGVRLTWRREIHAVEPDTDALVVQSAREWSANHRWTSYMAVVQRLRVAFGSAAVSITGDHSATERHDAARRLQEDASVRVLVGNLQAAGTGITLKAATHVVFNDLDWVPGNHWQAEDRIYRIGQTRAAFVTYLYIENTLDEFVAALLEAKARNIGVLETEAAHNATLLREVVDAVVRGERPSQPDVRGDPAQIAPRRSVGLLDDTLDLLARARRGLSSIESDDEQEYPIPSKSKPGEYNTVTIARGVARCSCSGFEYRGDCSHARQVVANLEPSSTRREGV